MIRTENLTKKYGGLVAVRDLNLDLPQGQFFAFLGPNGAGKTTTIKLLAGLLKPTSGRAFVGGYDIQKDPIEARRILSFVPDTPYLYDKLEPMEFMLFVGQLYGMQRSEVMRASDELFDLFDLNSTRKQLIEDLSHGTRQRLVIASALLHQPKVIIVDECSQETLPGGRHHFPIHARSFDRRGIGRPNWHPQSWKTHCHRDH
jgi:ABC-2 type transport system ATP-binding protein